MANTSIYAAFERMWSHIINKLSDKVSHSDDPVFALEDSEDVYADAINADTLQGHVADDFVRVLDTSANTETAAVDADTLGGRTPDEYAPAGYGLGTDCTYIDSFENITKSGFYMGNGGTPDGDWWNGYAIAINAGTQVTLEVWSRNGANKCKRVKIEGVWGEWEWVNPPMVVGVEYRTTERYNGKAVYTKVVDFGNLPANSAKTVAHGITGATMFISIRELVFRTATGIYLEQDDSVGVYGADIKITTNWSAGDYTAHVFLKYTKD